ncbi:hypothetical protein WBG78_04725 [Chryseolinea sp. T2]|uniref:hypothetical protein n=1 Tax=Chryseolinea sp. T2 TaxID=3129255 RepID=UPI003077D8F8
MKQLPMVIYILSGLFLGLTLIYGQINVDIQLNEAYYVVYLRFLTIPAMILLLAQGIVYTRAISTKRSPNKYLALFYLAGTIISVAGIAFKVFQSYAQFSGKSYYIWTEFESGSVAGFVVLYALSQIGYLLSLLFAKEEDLT